VPPPDETQQAAARQHFLISARHLRREQRMAAAQDGHHARRMGNPLGVWTGFNLERSFRMLAVIVAAIMAAVLATGGVVVAADGAVPGDSWYGIDLATEQVRLSLAPSTAKAIQLKLAFAEERLLEAEQLAEGGDDAFFQEALFSYGDTVSAAALRLGSGDGVDNEALADLLDEALGQHNEQLLRVLQIRNEAQNQNQNQGAQGQEQEQERERNGEGCVGVDPHPAAARLADMYDADYDDIMEWFCDGYGIGEIMLALRTSEQTDDADADDLLALKTEMGGWGQVWLSLDLIGKGRWGQAADDDDDDEPASRPGVGNQPGFVPPGLQGSGSEQDGDTDDDDDDGPPAGAPGRGNQPGFVPPGLQGRGSEQDGDTDEDEEGQGPPAGVPGRGNQSGFVPPGQQGRGPGQDGDIDEDGQGPPAGVPGRGNQP
jgi:hypothetical protein